MGELSRCLRLTAPVGMTDTDRREWLLVAYDEIKAIPSVEFGERCAHARKVADHPAKIVPSIFGLKFGEYHGANVARDKLRTREAQYQNRYAARLTDQADDDICTPEQAAAILAEHGMRSKFAPAPLREPTADELAEIAASMTTEATKAMGQ